MNAAIALLFPIALSLPGVLSPEPAAQQLVNGRAADAQMWSDALNTNARGGNGGRMSRSFVAAIDHGPVPGAGGFADGDTLPMDAPDLTAFDSVTPDTAFQVRIEQRMTIRITPRSQAPVPPDRFISLPDGRIGPGFSERKIGKCIPLDAIVAVRPDRGSRLLLFMRDNRIVSAELDRSCRARDFYLGFYMARTRDGRLCVGRDNLLSRSGMSCALTRIRLLVPKDP